MRQKKNYISSAIKWLALAVICMAEISCNTQKECYVITNNSDTIKGECNQLKYSLKFPYDSIMTPFIVNKDKKTKIDINITDIKSINLINKRKRDTTTYVIFGNDLWRLLAAKNDIGIYERNYVTDAGYSIASDAGSITNNSYAEVYNYYDDVAIFSNRILIIYIIDNLLYPYPPSIGKAVLQFINIRYNLNLTHDELVNNYFVQGKDFEYQTKLFNFILDKETELEKQEK